MSTVLHCTIEFLFLVLIQWKIIIEKDRCVVKGLGVNCGAWQCVFPWTRPAVNTPDNGAKGMLFFPLFFFFFFNHRRHRAYDVLPSCRSQSVAIVVVLLLLAFIFLFIYLFFFRCRCRWRIINSVRRIPTAQLLHRSIRPEAVQTVRLSNTRPTQTCTVPGLCCVITLTPRATV